MKNNRFFGWFLLVILCTWLAACTTQQTTAVPTVPPTLEIPPTQTSVPVSTDTAMPIVEQATNTAEPTSVPTTVLTEAQIQTAKSILGSACAVCHSPDRVNSVKTDQAGWETIISQMKDKGAVVQDTEVMILAQYLAETIQ